MVPKDDTLFRLWQDLALKRQLQAKLDQFRQRAKDLDRSIVSLRVAHRTEQEEVEKLESSKLTLFFYSILGEKDERLRKERAEAYAAKAKLDAAQQELDALNARMDALQVQLGELRGCEKAYEDAYRERINILRRSGGEAGNQILELEEQIAFRESMKKELGEAIASGDRALSLTKAILAKLDQADGWNTYDMIGGGGVISYIAKHGHLDEAQNMVIRLQNELTEFNTELADVQIKAEMQVSVDGFLRFADYFFDNLFTDWAVGSRISDSRFAVQRVRQKINETLKKLKSMEDAASREQTALKAKLDELVLQS